MNALPPDTAGIYEKAKKAPGGCAVRTAHMKRMKGTGSFLAQKKYTQEDHL